jgi:chaperonin cofactor prefoldin
VFFLPSLQDVFLLERRLRAIDEALADLQVKLEELKEALEWMQKLHPKSAYRVFANSIAIEVDPEKAKEIVEEEIKLLEAKIETLKKERERVEKELREAYTALRQGR